MYGMGGYSHMGVPASMQLGIGPLDMAANASDSKSGGGILDWINFGINTAVGVKDAITGTKTLPVSLAPVQPRSSDIKILGMSPTTLLLVGGAVAVGVVLLSSRKRR